MYKSLLLILLAMATLAAQAQCKLDASNYQLFFVDDFNYQDAQQLKNSGKWDADTLLGSGDTEYYSSTQIDFPRAGILRLKADYIPPGPQRNQINSAAIIAGRNRTTDIAYVSGGIRSKGAYDPTVGPNPTWQTEGFAYGMFEIRCKLPNNGKGVWPTFWLVSPGTEIDVIDNNNDEPHRLLSSGVLDWGKRNAYCEDPSHTKADCDALSAEFWTCGGRARKYGQDLSLDFNTYTVVWTPVQVTFFINGREQYTVTSSQTKT